VTRATTVVIMRSTMMDLPLQISRLLEHGSEWRRLLDAIVAADAAGARSVMRDHIAGFEQAIRKVL